MRVAVITGGSSGIGAAVARRLTADGWRCVLLARGRERLEAVAGEIGAEAEPCDVADREQVEAVAARVAERHAAVHLLVNNAGVPGGGRFLEAEPERIEQVTRINYLGSVWCLRAFLDLLRAGAPSDLVNVVSVAGTISFRSGPYSAAKHAQLAFSRGVTAELAPLGIRVHTITPGPVHTPGFPQGRLQRGRWTHRFVLEPEQVADAVLRAVERGKPEISVPWWLRVFGAAQGVAPGTLSRLMARREKP